MTIADQARNQAISLEAKKDRLSQRQSSDWSVTFTIQDVDMDQRFTSARMGTRYAMVLVEIGDDELPVQKEVRPAKPRQEPQPDGAKQKMDWRNVQPAAQAGIRCAETAFAVFLREERAADWQEAPTTADCVRLICGVASRSELGTNHKARVLWHQLDTEYRAWLAMENA